MIIEGKIFGFKNKLKKLFNCAADYLKEDFSFVVISVNFVSEVEIQALNKKFRGIDNVTDVLSFPNLNKTSKQNLKHFKHEEIDGQLFLGDIVICKKVAKKQAKQFQHSYNREVCFLALHGLLHLLGYDHIEAEDEKEMMATAEKILQEFGALR